VNIFNAGTLGGEETEDMAEDDAISAYSSAGGRQACS